MWFAGVHQGSEKPIFSNEAQTTALDYLKICDFITCWLLEGVTIKESLIITGMTNWNWIQFVVGFCSFFQRILSKKTWCLSPDYALMDFSKLLSLVHLKIYW